jgi:beta-lactamase regulating signal transducer with metallopeptidase domain
LKRAGRVVQFDGVEQPAIMGVLRPTLLLPTDGVELDDYQLRMVMLHELAHVRRGDIAANWALVVIRSIHWCHPVYWLAVARFRSLREQACDAFVVRKMEGESPNGYGKLLLTLAERRPNGTTWRVMLPASILSFFPSLFRQHAVRVRLKALRGANVKRRPWHAAIVAALLLLLIVCGFTVAREEANMPVDLPTWMASHRRSAGFEPIVCCARDLRRAERNS